MNPKFRNGKEFTEWCFLYAFLSLITNAILSTYAKVVLEMDTGFFTTAFSQIVCLFIANILYNPKD
jgi:hypothetical protein